MFMSFQICLLLLAQPVVDDANTPSKVITEILADFSARQQRWSSFEYDYHGTVSLPKGYYGNGHLDDSNLPPEITGPFPPERVEYPVRGTIAVDFQSKCVSKECETQILNSSLAKFIPRHERFTYDGAHYQVFQPREWNTSPDYIPEPHQPDLYLQGDQPRHGFFDLGDAPILFAHGILDRFPQDLRELPSPDELQYLGTRLLGSQLCDVIVKTWKQKDTPEYTWEYWIDRQQQSAVQRIVYKREDQEIMRYDIQHENSSGEWLPSRWRITRGLSDPENCERQDFTVDSRSFGKPLASYQMHATVQPGMVVRDQVLGRTYHLGAQEIEVIDDDHEQPISLTFLPFFTGFRVVPIGLAATIALAACMLWRNRAL